MKPPVDFRLIEDTHLLVLKSKMENLLHITKNRKVVKIEHSFPMIDNEEKVKFNNFRLKTNEDLKVMSRGGNRLG